MMLRCVSLLLTTHFGKCGYAVPSSPSDLVYLATAHSTAASLEPWSWPVVVRGRDANTTHPIDTTHFAAIDDDTRKALPRGGWCAASVSRAQLAAAADAVDALAGAGGAIAVGFVQIAHPSTIYGHVWNYVHAFYCALIRPRRDALVDATGVRRRELTIYLPAGSANCSSEHGLLLGLFGTERARRAFGLRLERAAWVPEANQQKAWSYAFGGVPPALRGRVALLSNFRVARGAFALAGRAHAEFRADAWRSVGVPDAALPRTVLYILSARWPTKRTVVDEEGIVRALAEHVATEHPSLRFVAAHAHELSVAAEVALFADARLVISLWGSSLHNCRFMTPGTTIVEIYGALNRHYGDTTLYHNVCSGCGILHAPLIVRSSFPRIATETLVDGRAHVISDRGLEQRADARRARVNATELLEFVSRVFPADPCAGVDWEGVHAEYNAFFVGRRNPNNVNWTMNLVHRGVWAGARAQFPQYGAPSRWCRARKPYGTVTNGAEGRAMKQKSSKRKLPLAAEPPHLQL